MNSTDFVLVSQKMTIVSVEAERASLKHTPLQTSPLNLRLTLADGFKDIGEAIRFTVFGAECVLQRFGGVWALSRNGAFASTRADTVVEWVAALGPDTLFYLMPAESALLVSPFGEQAARPAPSSRRRLLIVAPWLVVGGAEKVNLDLITGLKPDLEVTLVTTLGAGPWTSRFEAQVKRLILLGQLLPPQVHGAALALLARRLEIDCVLLSNTKEGYEALPFIRQHFPELPIFDLLHGQGGKLEGGGYPALSMPFDHHLTGRLVITDYLRDLMIKKYGIAPHRITRIYNGVDLDHFTPVKKQQSAFPIVAFIGRLAIEKHPEHVVAIAKALTTTTPCLFKIAGDGPLREILGRMLVEDPPHHQVDLIGHIEDVRALLAETHVLLLTSEMEGFPIIVLEALAMGVPVICSAVGGIPELVRHGIDGLLVPYGQDFIETAAHFLQQLLTDPERRLRMGESGRRRVEAEFGLTTMSERYRTLFSCPPHDVDAPAWSEMPGIRALSGSHRCYAAVAE